MISGLIALAQAIYTSVTLYQTGGDQIDRYGCVAFGLTVAPFVLMSIINLIGNIISPTYNAIYLTETSVMREARRHGCRFNGVVGKLKEGPGALLESDISEANWVESAIFERVGENNQLTVNIFPTLPGNFENLPSQNPAEVVQGDEENTASSGKERAEINEKEVQKKSQKFIVAENNPSEEPEYIIGIPSCPLIRPSQVKSVFYYIGAMISLVFHLPATLSLLRNGNSLFGDDPPDAYILRVNPATSDTDIARGPDNYEPLTKGISFWGIFLALAPIAIVGGLSHFRAGGSTVAQRAWTMAWLGSDIVAGWVLGLELVPRDKQGTQQHFALISTIVFALIFGAPALGGFVVVGQMVKEYGSCVTLP